MCYKSPGPRCSSYARQRLNALELRINQRGYEGFDEYQQLKGEVANAELDFDATPAGQAYLRFRIEQYGDSRHEYLERLENGKLLRQKQLDAIKAIEHGDVGDHQMEKPSVNTLKGHGSEIIDSKELPSEQREEMFKEYRAHSRAVVRNLTPEEQAAVTWMTSNGSFAANSKLAEKPEGWTWEEASYGKPYRDAYVQEQVALLDSAFAKNPLPENVRVYRGLSESVLPVECTEGDTGKLKSYLAERYPVGGEVTIPEYMATSGKPETAMRFSSRQNVLLDIETSKAMAVSQMSTWGETELEFLVNRSSKFKVDKVETRHLQRTGRGGRMIESDYIVIKLVEVP